MLNSMNLKIFVELFNAINFKFSITFLQETWESENDVLSHFSLEGYELSYAMQ